MTTSTLVGTPDPDNSTPRIARNDCDDSEGCEFDYRCAGYLDCVAYLPDVDDR